MKTFLIRLPPDNQRNIEAFEQLLAHLHEMLPGRKIAFEVRCSSQNIGFYCGVEADISQVLVGQIYATFPDCEVVEVAPLKIGKNNTCIGVELALAKHDLYPIRTYTEFKGEPLAGLLSVLSHCKSDEQVCYQIICEPIPDSAFQQVKLSWQRKLERWTRLLSTKYWVKAGLKELLGKKIQEKSKDRLFRANLRLGLASNCSKTEARQRLDALIGAVLNFNALDLNSFGVRKIYESADAFDRINRQRLSLPFLLSKSELAGLFHLPGESDAPNVLHVISKRAAAPKDLPTTDADVSLFGQTNFRDRVTPFGLKLNDRRRHLYVLGKSGSGKSKLLELLIKSDLDAGRGVAVLDPHGDLIDNILQLVPRERVKDVVLFDPSDLEYPPAFNPLDQVREEHKIRTTLGFIEIFRKLFGANWTPRLEHVLRYTVLALLDTPGTTILSILKMLTDKNYRQMIVRNIKDSTVKNFWVSEFASWSERFDNEAITPLLNKVGQFVSTNLIRNIVGQTNNLINFREIMDNRKILLMKVSKGMLGEDNAALLGAMAVTKIYQAAMSRADIPENRRTDFYFYVDEFHNFATESFDEILSEARKYRLNITLANQFLGQLDNKTLKTVFGNVGSIVSFRASAEDAAFLSQEFTPRFKVRDIINLGVREFCTKLTIDGEVKEAFSGRTLDLAIPTQHHRVACVEHSRQLYAKPLSQVQQSIATWEEKGISEPSGTGPIRPGGNGFNEPLI